MLYIPENFTNRHSEILTEIDAQFQDNNDEAWIEQLCDNHLIASETLECEIFAMVEQGWCKYADIRKQQVTITDHGIEVWNQWTEDQKELATVESNARVILVTLCDLQQTFRTDIRKEVIWWSVQPKLKESQAAKFVVAMDWMRNQQLIDITPDANGYSTITHKGFNFLAGVDLFDTVVIDETTGKEIL